MATGAYEATLKEWKTLLEESADMEKTHDVYLEKLRELHRAQEASQKAVKHSKYRLSQIKDDLKMLEMSTPPSAEEKESVEQMKKEMVELRTKLTEMVGELPILENGLYLSTILGSNLNLSLLNKNDRYRYKQEYEKFKVSVAQTILLLFTLSFFYPTRLLDALSIFLLVWYYCTLTIRESILSVNGSRIKGWWMIHHYVSCVLCGITLTWKDGECYQQFRLQFIIFCMYIAIVQILQSQYQSGCLRRLHALGQRYSMDITVEGFSSWMFKGLTFLIPFLVLGYLFQFYNAYTLYYIFVNHHCEGEWQVWTLCALFLLVGCCNLFTLVRVIINKRRASGTYSTVLGFTTKYRSKSHAKLS